LSLWRERFRSPTWQDDQRQRTRFTQADLLAQAAATAFNQGPNGAIVRRRLERPVE
jgi:predicted amidophosphoribosyltransferase